VKDFCEELDWRPDRYLLVSGAIRHDSYSYYEEMILQDHVLSGKVKDSPQRGRVAPAAGSMMGENEVG